MGRSDSTASTKSNDSYSKLGIEVLAERYKNSDSEGDSEFGSETGSPAGKMKFVGSDDDEDDILVKKKGTQHHESIQVENEVRSMICNLLH